MAAKETSIIMVQHASYSNCCRVSSEEVNGPSQKEKVAYRATCRHPFHPRDFPRTKKKGSQEICS